MRLVVKMWNHAGELHDVMQIAAGTTAIVALVVSLIFNDLDHDHPAFHWMAEMGRIMAVFSGVA